MVPAATVGSGQRAAVGWGRSWARLVAMTVPAAAEAAAVALAARPWGKGLLHEQQQQDHWRDVSLPDCPQNPSLQLLHK